MRPMTFPENPLERRALAVAVVVSLAIHGLILFVNNQKPKQGSPLPRIEASLARKPVPVETPVPRLPEPPKKQAKTPNKPQARPRVMAIQQPSRSTVQSTPKWTVAEKAEMNDFLNELASEAKAKPKPTLAQVFERALEVFGPARILFGTDSNTFPAGWRRDRCEEQQRVLATIGVDAVNQELIFRGNARRLLGLS